jgi:hypothetical protein
VITMGTLGDRIGRRKLLSHTPPKQRSPAA